MDCVMCSLRFVFSVYTWLMYQQRPAASVPRRVVDLVTHGVRVASDCARPSACFVKDDHKTCRVWKLGTEGRMLSRSETSQVSQ